MSGHAFRPSGGNSIAAVRAAAGTMAADADCFADEVVIDFPSVVPAVERMRSAFVDDGSPSIPMNAEITLSPRQAFDGASVFLYVPVRCTCRACGGRGETWPDRCQRCAGSGTELRRHEVQVSVPSGVADGARFRFLVTARPDPPTPIELRVAVR